MTGARPPALIRGVDGAVWFGLLALLVLAPLPLGANRPLAWSAMGLWAAFLLGGWTLSMALGHRPLAWRKALIVPLVVFLGELAWIIASLVPGLGLANPLWQLASEQLARPLPQRLALSADAGLVALMRLLAYVTVFWLSLQYCRSRDRAEKMLVWICWSGLAVAVYGLVNFFAGNEYLLWYPRWTGMQDVTGTFVNRNHYATFAGFGLLCAMGIGVMAFRAAWRVSDRSQAGLARGIECLIGRPLVYFIAMLVIAMAWLQSHSRMGMASVALGIGVMLILMMAVGLIRRNLGQWVVIALLGFFLLQVSGNATLERISETRGDINRIALFDIVTDQIASAPYTGSGYGSFAAAFQMYRDVRLPSANIFTAAHNSYLELAAEIGIPAAILFVSGIAWCAGLCLVGAFRRRTDRLYPVVAVAVTVVAATHALLDFSIQIPAVALLFAAILGMGVAQSWSTE